MRVSEVAKRYASALHGLTKELGSHEKVLLELRTLKDVFSKDKSIKEFINSPVVVGAGKEKALEACLKTSKVSEAVKSFVLLLASKNRIIFFEEIYEAFQIQIDTDNGVTRGSVQSVDVLNPEERASIEDRVSKATGKRVILSYSENPELIGGLLVKVGSYNFDDTLITHLSRLKDQLNRRIH